VQRPQIELGGRLDATIFVVDRCTASAILPRRESRSSPPLNKAAISPAANVRRDLAIAVSGSGDPRQHSLDPDQALPMFASLDLAAATTLAAPSHCSTLRIHCPPTSKVLGRRRNAGGIPDTRRTIRP
jgi:hypothetical protein